MNAIRSIPLWLIFIVAGVHQVIMGGTFPFARYVLQLMDPFAVAFIRYVLSSVVLVAIAWRMGKKQDSPSITGRDKKIIAILGLTIVVLNQTLYLYGQKFTTAAHGGLLFAATPVFVYLLAMKHLGEKWSIRKGIGILMAVAGTVIIFFEQGLKFNYDILLGDIIILLAVIAWAYYTVYGKPLVMKYGALRVTAWSLGFGTLVYFPFGLYRLIIADLSRMDSYGWLAILYIALITSVIGYSLWYWLIKQMEASRVAVLTNIQPLVAGFLGYYLLGEAITWPFVVAGLIILTGVVITQRA
ncbi:MAG: EamA family transporter [FCB group bacterium]|nr:EamA family transporter [FCB group bacterium]